VASISRSRTIAVPPESVWAVLDDFGSIASWAPTVDHSCLLRSGPTGPVGTERRLQVGRQALVERITEHTPPSALAYRIEGLPRLLGEVSNRWTLRPAAGATVVTLTSTVHIGARPWQRAAERVAARLLARTSGALLTGLANRLERTHG